MRQGFPERSQGPDPRKAVQRGIPSHIVTCFTCIHVGGTLPFQPTGFHLSWVCILPDPCTLPPVLAPKVYSCAFPILKSPERSAWKRVLMTPVYPHTQDAILLQGWPLSSAYMYTIEVNPMCITHNTLCNSIILACAATCRNW